MISRQQLDKYFRQQCSPKEAEEIYQYLKANPDFAYQYLQEFPAPEEEFSFEKSKKLWNLIYQRSTGKIGNINLTVSVIILLPIAITYGVAPDFTLSHFFDFKIETPDLKNIFRAITGLYLSVIGLWIVGIFNRHYWLTATITNVVFMSGLGFGRLISLALDGTPSPKFFIGMLLEFLLAAWGIYNLKRYKETKIS